MPAVRDVQHGDVVAGADAAEDTEALVICCETARGNVFMNIALRYNVQSPGELAAAAGE